MAQFRAEARGESLEDGEAESALRLASQKDGVVAAAYTLAQPKGTITNSGPIPIPNCSSLP